MFRPSELAAVAAGILLFALSPLPEPAQAGVATEAARSAFDAAAAASAPPAPAPRYRLRCWQQGRLVIEENGIELPAGSVKLRATDARRQPVTLIETQNATCLVRAMPPDTARGEPK